jgi:prenyltransferase beta subunit
MNRWLSLSLIFFLVPSANGVDGPRREPFDEAIDRGLEFLANSQNPDGSWLASRGQKDPAVSALCVMAFLSAGHVPGEGPYSQNVEKGIRYVMKCQLRNGIFAPINGGNHEMYYHGICTLMLAEAAGMIPDPVESRNLKDRLQDAVKIILVAQKKQGDHRGGWRYTVNSFDSDMSVTGWQLMALRAAKNLGCDIPPQSIDEAIKYIERSYDSFSGGYRYQVQGHTTVPCTGTAVLALELCGKDHHRSPEALKAGAYLLKNELNVQNTHFFYGIYYTSQAMFQLGENYWTSFRPILHKLLLKNNPPRGGGYWQGWGWDDKNFGPNYCTAMGILALTVEYRFLPIYQRSEEATEKKDDR